MGLGGCEFKLWPNPSYDLLLVSLLISETLQNTNYSEDWNTLFKDYPAGHQDITN